MKVLKAREEFVSNYEVLRYMQELSEERKSGSVKVDQNVSTIQYELLQYLNQMSTAATQTESTIVSIMTVLNRYSLTPAEKLQIVNLQPTSAPQLHVLIEYIDDRLNQSEQENLLQELKKIYAKSVES